jgi:hypothetical protein
MALLIIETFLSERQRTKDGKKQTQPAVLMNSELGSSETMVQNVSALSELSVQFEIR